MVRDALAQPRPSAAGGSSAPRSSCWPLNLRVAVGSIGVVLEPVRDDLGMTHDGRRDPRRRCRSCASRSSASGSAGAVRRLGLHRAAVLVLPMVAVGPRPARPSSTAARSSCCAASLALAGAAVGNVILPPLVKAHFPDRIPLVSSLYGAALMGGAATASVATVPLSDAFGGWRAGIGLWAVLAGVALVPWLVLLRRDVHAGRCRPERLALRDIARSPVAWAMVADVRGAVRGGLRPVRLVRRDPHRRRGLRRLRRDAARRHQRGRHPADAGAAVAHRAWSATGPTCRGRSRPSRRPGWLGVLLAPTAAPWLWAVLLGLGGGAFTWTLTMIARRTRTTAGTAALSVATQGIGYLIAGDRAVRGRRAARPDRLVDRAAGRADRAVGVHRGVRHARRAARHARGHPP